MKIKICGVTDPDDAALAASYGADYIGIILAPGFRRSVTIEQALEIAEEIQKNGSKPVAVFYKPSRQDIMEASAYTKIEIIELHEFQQEDELKYLTSQFSEIFCGFKPTAKKIPKGIIPIYDNGQGSGKNFDWNSFSPPKSPWFLGGGLNVNNLQDAFKLLKPDGVTVSTGVEIEGLTRKDPKKLEQFITLGKKL